jgi:hypothetical protein
MPASKTRMMLGWRSVAAMLASRLKRVTNEVSVANASSSTLTAQDLPCPMCVAR